MTKYLKADGEKEVHVRKIAYGARRHLTKIRADLDLLEGLLAVYERSKTG